MEDRFDQDLDVQDTEDIEFVCDPTAREECPECYGDPEKVCPTNAEGFIEPQERCSKCVFLRDCLQLGIQSRAMLKPAERSEPPEPAEPSRVSCFLKRWSDKKLEHACRAKPPK